MGQLTEDEIGHANFQQGNASAHMAHVSMPLLHDVFSDQLISRDIWPLRLPDLTPPDFYLWGAMRSAVYKDNPHSLCDLKEAITYFIRNISHIELVQVFANKIK
jgi:hypothetical protein